MHHLTELGATSSGNEASPKIEPGWKPKWLRAAQEEGLPVKKYRIQAPSPDSRYYEVLLQ